MKCKICNKEFKRLTASHIKTHNITYAEYLEKYEKDLSDKKHIIEFFKEYYIGVRYRFLKYLPQNNGTPFTIDIKKNKRENELKGTKKRTWPLTDKELQEHLEGKGTVGIYFPNGYTKIIGLDIDIPSKELLKQLVELLYSYGISDKQMLLSSSGGKGYHVDIFLESLIPDQITDQFHKVILKELKVDKHVIELRGGSSKQGYKLPLGIHFKTGAICTLCDINGDIVQNPLPVLKSREKAHTSVIAAVAKIRYFPTLTDEQHYEMQELQDSYEASGMYDNTVEQKIASIEKLLKDGFHEGTNRNNTIFKVSMYLKDIKGLCLAEAKKEIFNWIGKTWSKSIVDGEMLEQAKTTIEGVYRRNAHLQAGGARKVTISQHEIKEILSVTTKNKLQTQALRRLYYAMAIHSKAYADKNGEFYFTYEQMAKTGVAGNRTRVKTQIEQLQEMGKVMIIRQNESQQKGIKKLPNIYFLPNLVSVEVTAVKQFDVCSHEEKCSDCLERAYCHLLPSKERAKYIKGKEFKQLPSCPYN